MIREADATEGAPRRAKDDPQRPGTLALPCPRCGYDLRGTVGSRCSECGQGFNRKRVQRNSRRRLLRISLDEPWKYQAPFRRLSYVPFVWLATYFLEPSVAGTDLLKGTLDRVRLSWYLVPFLAVSLQLPLAFAGHGLTRSRRRSSKIWGAWVVTAALLLMAGHVAISVANWR